MTGGLEDTIDPAERDARVKANQDLRPMPRIAIQAFCETPDVAAVLEAASGDRRMAKTHVKIHMGGAAAATDFYKSAPTPNLLFVESREKRERVLEQLDALAAVCDPGTKVVVIGHDNDVLLYRELLRRGISDYMVVPFDMFDVVREIGEIYLDPATGPIGRTLAFASAKGGSGSSTVAHNVGFVLAHMSGSDVLIADMDLAWGTAGLDFNQDPPQGIADAVFSPERIDDVYLDRILSKCSDHLNLLASPATLDRTYDFEEDAFANLIDIARGGVPTVVLDLPHQWTGWVRRTLALADEVVITVTPDLASLRNAKTLVDQLKVIRPNDSAPHYVVNQVGVPKRPEIKPEDFAKAFGFDPLAVIPFEPALFGTAANNGQMIEEVSAKSPVADLFRHIAHTVSGRNEPSKSKKRPRASLLSRLHLGRRKSA
jgi:pilus assembly protein CpaE